MTLERRQPTKPLKDRTEDVLRAIARLKWMRGYPTESDAIAVIAGAIAAFCETCDVNHKNERFPDPTLDLGWVNPLVWVVGQVAATFEFFPPPIRWRMIYEQRFETLDGKSSRDLLSAVED
jgi:hypothetical protein